MVRLYYLILFFALGFFLQRKLNARNQLRLLTLLNKFILYISLPSLVFIHISKLKLDSSLFLPFFTAWGAFIFSSILIFLAAIYFKWKKDIIFALMLSAALCNSSFLGFPLTIAFFGEKGLPYAIIYDQLGSFLILSTIGVLILSLSSSKKFSFKEVAIKIVTFPSFVALIIAAVFGSSYMPEFAIKTLELLGSLLTVVAFIVIGLSLKIKVAKNHMKPFIFALFLKLTFLPISIFLLFYFLGYHSLASKVTIFETAMAPMVSSSMLAILYNIQKELVSSILAYGIVLSFFTLPLIYAIIS